MVIWPTIAETDAVSALNPTREMFPGQASLDQEEEYFIWQMYRILISRRR